RGGPPPARTDHRVVAARGRRRWHATHAARPLRHRGGWRRRGVRGPGLAGGVHGSHGPAPKRHAAVGGPGGASVPLSKPVWFPADPSSTNVGRFMAAQGIQRFEDLERRSIDEPEWFWDAVVKFLGIDFPTRYRYVLDLSDGIPWARWFVGGKT